MPLESIDELVTELRRLRLLEDVLIERIIASGDNRAIELTYVTTDRAATPVDNGASSFRVGQRV